MNSPKVELVVADLAGTTVEDNGLVEEAFIRTNNTLSICSTESELEIMLDYVRKTMGQSKISVFRELCGSDEDFAQKANKEFEKSYEELVGEGKVVAIAGAENTLMLLKEEGIKIAFNTGFSPRTRELIIDSLGWTKIADAALSPVDVGGRGRPYPDMALMALILTHTSEVGAMVTIGDTTSDILAGQRAGAQASYGVLTGAHNFEKLNSAGATTIFNSITELPHALNYGCE